MEKITFRLSDEESVDLYVIEQTTIGGTNYLLVTESEEGDADAFILKENPASDDDESVYDEVDNDEELKAVAKVFESLLEDIELI